MISDTKKFKESLMPYLVYLKNEDDDKITIPYVGKRVDAQTITPYDILKLIYEFGYNRGIDEGERKKMKELRKVIGLSEKVMEIDGY